MKIKSFEKYYIADDEGNSGCVIRTFCKLYDKQYDEVYRDLKKIVKEKGLPSYNEPEVFEEYMRRHNTFPIEFSDKIRVRELDLEKGSYVIHCSDGFEWNHLVPFIDGVVYDKSDDCLALQVMKIYQKK